ncbi:hypothetical protein JOD31_000035 [Methylopila capsulata]|uniref:Oxygen tolerance n=1 Tax=Methylopila capsulata TaxID=61654 RepID=A0A9W6IRE6_9HYPH|nr:BatD family protein [Methylopila capsulata]MBM7849823.1 hypothetical protein [Methylopila capsulata]GLK55113.1 hypothetical protein GCM10008170_11320 [Methylopila capsulata]
MRPLLAAFALLALIALRPGAALADPSEFDDVRLEVTPLNTAAPYPRELVLLRIRGVYRPLVNREKLIQPPLTNFAWQELGKDAVSVIEDDGYTKRLFERTIAIYPEKSGPLVIEPFVHKLTVVDGARQREIEVKSKPITLDVAEWQGPRGPDDQKFWWLPAGKVEVLDDWSIDPERVPRGVTAKRTVTILAEGVPADALPPTPLMTSSGIISFRGPETRETKITAKGPVSRASYSWEMRPITAYPATVQEIRFQWFDTGARTMREAVIPARRMAWAAANVTDAAPPPPPERPTVALLAGAGGAAFLAGLVVMLLGVGRETLRLPTRLPHEARAMKRAARQSDPSAFRAAVTALARHEPGPWRTAPEVREGLAALDRHLFAGAGSTPCPDLRALARSVIQARRAAAVAAPRASALAPLDGPITR